MPTLDDILVAPPDLDTVVDPLTWFDSPGPFELEIGCGKGGFLLSRARAHPEIRLLGIEWANKFFSFAADRMARWQLNNVRVMRTDAGPFLMRCLPAECLDALHLYHPDPWPKKRHHKRRLVQAPFATAAARRLKPGALWLIQSDHEEYFRWIEAVLDAEPLLQRVPPADTREFAGPDWIGTNYEIKYAREHRSIYRTAYRRV